MAQILAPSTIETEEEVKTILSMDVNVTEIMENANDSVEFNGMKIIQVIIASMGVITNIIVVIVFLNDRKLRRKIPNICIINQVGYSYS